MSGDLVEYTAVSFQRGKVNGTSLFPEATRSIMRFRYLQPDCAYSFGIADGLFAAAFCSLPKSAVSTPKILKLTMTMLRF